MSYYSHITHKSDLLSYDKDVPWLSPELIKSKPHLNGILNRIHHSIKLINFILTERDKHVNIFRKTIGTDKLPSETSWYLVLFTESYFTYVQNMLNAYSELIYEVMGNLHETLSGDFPKLWYRLKISSYLDNRKISDYFQNKMLWYEILIQKPRNQLVSHDTETAGYGWSDHGIDVYIGKHGNHDPVGNKSAIELLQKIISNHVELQSIRISDYFHPIYREIVAKIDLLTPEELIWLDNAGGIAGYDFPYIPNVTVKLQDFIDFMEKWLVSKYQMCPNCNKSALQIIRIPINPTILNDPKNIWFGWRCPTCSYRHQFNL